jgi:hypothetical protein
MLGDWLLVGSARSSIVSGSESSQMGVGAPVAENQAKVYLPKGEWYDFWTGHRRQSPGEWQIADWPSYAGGPLLVKGGAIIPMGPVTSYIDQEPLEVIRLDIYPAGTSQYTVYEDDGRTYDYQKGEFTTTDVKVSEHRDAIEVNVGPRRGSYPAMPQRRAYLISVHTAYRPVGIFRNGQALREMDSWQDLVRSAGAHGWYFDEQTQVAWVKATTGWRFGADRRGAQNDPEQDTAHWDNAATGESAGSQIRLALPQIVVTAQQAALAAGPGDHTFVRAVITDPRSGKVDPRSGVPVRFTVAGPASFSGNPTVMSRNGIAEIDLRAGSTAGTVTVSASAPTLPGTTTTLVIDGPPARLKVEVPETPILADGRSIAAVRVTVLDAAGRTVANASQPVQLSIEGQGALDCGAAPCSLPLEKGSAKTKVIATTTAGQIQIRARVEGLEPVEATLETVRGEFRLQASPPERIKLVSDGSWLKYRVNLYATVEKDGRILRRAAGTVHLHITGPSGSTPPPDRDATLVNGIATFSDVGFDPPAKYVFHVTGEGVEPAEIPIY